MNIIETLKKSPLLTAFDKKPLFIPQRVSDLVGSQSLQTLLQSFEVFFICFDEPNRKQNWRQIKKLFPHAQKIEGVKGFDAALKTCARESTTEHFFTIDGDNCVLEEKLYQTVNFDQYHPDWVLSWSAINSVNGLSYGNGGLKLWPRQEALKIQSHENSNPDSDPTDYCFVAKYYQVNNHLTQTNINETAFQAFRAGFREGVKMSLVWGKQENLTRENYDIILGKENRERLWVWCNVGADTKNGLWAIYGARLGFKMNAIDKFDYSLINSYDWIGEFWREQVLKPFLVDKSKAFQFSMNPEELYKETKNLGRLLNEAFALNMAFYNAVDSKAFKEKFKNPPREGLLSQYRNS